MQGGNSVLKAGDAVYIIGFDYKPLKVKLSEKIRSGGGEMWRVSFVNGGGTVVDTSEIFLTSEEAESSIKEIIQEWIERLQKQLSTPEALAKSFYSDYISGSDIPSEVCDVLKDLILKHFGVDLNSSTSK